MQTDGGLVSRSDKSDQSIIDVIIIDDDKSIYESSRQILERNGYHVEIAKDGTQGLELAERFRPRVVVVDLKMPGVSGMDVISKISEIDPNIVTIVVTGYGSIEDAVETMKMGAVDFLTKPLAPEKILESVKLGIEQSTARIEKKAAEGIKPFMGIDSTQFNRQNILLNGLEVLGQFHSLGLQEGEFFNDLKFYESEAEYYAQRIGRTEEKNMLVLDIVHDLRLVDRIISKYGYKKNALIQVLLDIQVELNWLPRHTLKWVSMRLNIPYTSISTIVNFYTVFSLEPRGAHLIEICVGTACHVRGADGVIERVSSLIDLQPGQTDSKQLFTLRTVHCMGCCALGPAVKIDNKYYSNPKVTELEKLFENIRRKED